MKKITLSVLILSACLFNAYGQSQAKEVLKIRGTRLVYPLMRKWIGEFNKVQPGIKILISPNSPSDSIDFSIASYALGEADLKGDLQAVVVAKYVQLPIVNINRKDLDQLQHRGVTESSLRNIFFGEQPVLLTSSTAPSPLELYVRDKPVCAVKAFAGHYGEQTSKLNGNGIKGDDEDLAEAVRKDVNGFSFNNLGFIYDIKTRKVTKDLAVVPMDLNENGVVDADEKIYSTMDEVIGFIEKTIHLAFVNEKVNLTYHRNNQKQGARIFLNWILKEGQVYNHEFGFLLMDDALLATQVTIAAQK